MFFDQNVNLKPNIAFLPYYNKYNLDFSKQLQGYDEKIFAVEPQL